MSAGLPELPVTGVDQDEASTLTGFLDRSRVTLQRQAHGLDSTALATTLPPSDLTLGALLKHLAFVEGYWFRWIFAGGEQTEPWRSVDWDAEPDWDLVSATADAPEELWALLHREVTEAREVVRGALDRPEGLAALSVRARHGRRVSLRWILVHMIEEYARHCGHADLLRQSIDGAVDL